MSARSVLNPTFQRLLARSTRNGPNRRIVQSVHVSTAVSTSSSTTEPVASSSYTPPLTTPALSALLSRLSLPPIPEMHAALSACLTHPSFVSTSEEESNAILASLGNSLLGLFASEHLAALYPLLPTKSLKIAVTAYVGPTACYSVARELGVGVQGGGNAGTVGGGRGMASAGVTVRWKRDYGEVDEMPVAKGFRSEERTPKPKRKDNFESVVASTVRAFVGLIYQQQGIHAAREFTHAHFLSRHLDMTTVFNFRKPKHVLSSVVTKHLADAGVSPSEFAGKIETRILASTGKNSISPLFNIGIFLPSGLKLSEGHGSSYAMAEHRAAVNALHSIFLVRGDKLGESSLSKLAISDSGGMKWPSMAHGDWAVSDGILEEGVKYTGSGDIAGRESIVESAQR